MIRTLLLLAARALIEKDPGYSFVTARLLLDTIRLEAVSYTHLTLPTKA